MAWASSARASALIVSFLFVAAGCAHGVATRGAPSDRGLARGPVHLRLGGTDVVLVGVDRGIELLSTHDDFLAAMTPLDRQMRLRGGPGTDEDALIASIAREVRDFDAHEVQVLEHVFAGISADLERLGLSLPLPSVIEVVRTTGREEIDAPIALGYTRGQTIVLNGRAIDGDLEELVRHELFHVLTRNAPVLRDALYAVIGYRPVAPIVLPAALEERRLTNPDSPESRHVIRVQVGGADVEVANFLFADRPYRGGHLFDYVVPRLVMIDEQGDVASDASGAPRTFGIDEVDGYFEQVGLNTDYVIQPEEVLADNFALLLLGRRVRTPAVTEQMLAVLHGD
jgi:hypothetical protein